MLSCEGSVGWRSGALSFLLLCSNWYSVSNDRKASLSTVCCLRQDCALALLLCCPPRAYAMLACYYAWSGERLLLLISVTTSRASPPSRHCLSRSVHSPRSPLVAVASWCEVLRIPRPLSLKRRRNQVGGGEQASSPARWQQQLKLQGMVVI